MPTCEIHVFVTESHVILPFTTFQEPQPACDAEPQNYLLLKMKLSK